MIDPSCARDRLVSLLRFAGRLSGLAVAVRPAALADFSDQGSLPVIASVSGNDIHRLRFRIFVLTCRTWFVLVRRCPSLSTAIVTQLVTHAALFSGILSGRTRPRLATAQRRQVLHSAVSLAPCTCCAPAAAQPRTS